MTIRVRALVMTRLISARLVATDLKFAHFYPFLANQKMREIEPEAAKEVSERQGGQRLDESRLISCIQTCFHIRR